MSSRLTGIQWLILKKMAMAAIGTISATTLLLMITGAILSEIDPWRIQIEQWIGIKINSSSYFILMGGFFTIGLIIALTFTFYLGFPIGRELKKSLMRIADATEAISRGKLDYRIQNHGSDEIMKLGSQFNHMAERFEKQVNSLQRLVDENTRLLQQTEQVAALEERRKLARDLHDAVSQQLFAISMSMAALPRILEQNPEKAKEKLVQIENLVSQAQQELRALIMHLRPVHLEGYSLREGLEQLFHELSHKHPEIEWKWELEDNISLGEGIEDQLFRVVQEVISNMLRHSKASLFQFKLYKKEERIFLKLEDNGIGFDLRNQKKSSYGLNTMKERIEDLGGRIDLLSYPNKGTRIHIIVPIP